MKYSLFTNKPVMRDSQVRYSDWERILKTSKENFYEGQEYKSWSVNPKVSWNPVATLISDVAVTRFDPTVFYGRPPKPDFTWESGTMLVRVDYEIDDEEDGVSEITDHELLIGKKVTALRELDFIAMDQRQLIDLFKNGLAVSIHYHGEAIELLLNDEKNGGPFLSGPVERSQA